MPGAFCVWNANCTHAFVDADHDYRPTTAVAPDLEYALTGNVYYNSNLHHQSPITQHPPFTDGLFAEDVEGLALLDVNIIFQKQRQQPCASLPQNRTLFRFD